LTGSTAAVAPLASPHRPIVPLPRNGCVGVDEEGNDQRVLLRRDSQSVVVDEQAALGLVEARVGGLDRALEHVEVRVPPRHLGERRTVSFVEVCVVEIHFVAHGQGRAGPDRTEEVSPLAGDGLRDGFVLDLRVEVEAVRSDEYLKHPQRRVLGQRALLVPELRARAHHHQVVRIGDEFVPLAVVVAHDARRDPRDYLLVSVWMHRDERVRVHEGLDDGGERAVAVVVVVRQVSTGEVEVDSELPLVLCDVGAGRLVEALSGGGFHGDGTTYRTPLTVPAAPTQAGYVDDTHCTFICHKRVLPGPLSTRERVSGENECQGGLQGIRAVSSLPDVVDAPPLVDDTVQRRDDSLRVLGLPDGAADDRAARAAADGFLDVAEHRPRRPGCGPAQHGNGDRRGVHGSA